MQKFFGTAATSDGKPLPGASVLVTVRATGLPASLFADDESTPVANPFLTSGNGRFDFSAANGSYDVSITKAGVTEILTKVKLQDSDIADGVETIQKSVTQPGHGFAVENAIRHNGTIWVKAQADVDTNSEVQGIVSYVSGAIFVVILSGSITTLSGKTPGTVYFLDPVTPGGLTATDPLLGGTAGQISRACVFAITATTGIVYQGRGFRVNNGAFAASAVAYTPEFADLWSAPLPALMSSAIHQLIKLVRPIGEPIWTLNPSLPTGPYVWLDGAEVSKSTYSTLYAIFGHTYETAQYGGTAVSDSDLNFRLPDLRGMTNSGADSFGTARGARSKLTFANAATQGTQYGEDAHALTSAENGPHTHTSIAVNGSGTGLDTPGSFGPVATNTGSSGSGTAHNTMQPTVLGRWYCRY